MYAGVLVVTECPFTLLPLFSKHKMWAMCMPICLQGLKFFWVPRLFG
jgi:hypothetical protein